LPRDRAFDRVPIEAFGRKNLYPVEVVEKQFNSLRVGVAAWLEKNSSYLKLQ
jgi:hypothetical protein